MNKNIENRYYTIDILRFIAIFCIILAHAEPPNIIFEIRNFDVTLMILVGGMTFYISSSNKKINYFDYLKKRFRRLILPTWIFLTIFFVLFMLLGIVTKNSYQFSIETLITSYALIGGIGYVWIMRVFFLVAIISPLILKVSKSIKSNAVYFLSLVGIYIIYMILIFVNSKTSGIIRFIMDNVVLVMIAWGIIAAIGIRIKKLSDKEINIYMLISLGIYIILMISNGFNSIQGYKYPPTIYYISYGIFISLFLLQILKLNIVYKLFDNKFVKYIAVNSLEIYFCHIIPIWILNIYGENFSIINSSFISRFIFIMCISILLTVLKDKIISRKRYIK